MKTKGKIGNIKIGLETTEIMNVEILTNKKIERKNVKDYFVELIKLLKKEK